jgi:hypothetical protein
MPGDQAKVVAAMIDVAEVRDAGSQGRMSRERRCEQVRDVRRRLAHEGPPCSRDRADDFDTVTVPERDCDALRDLLIAEGVETIVEVGLAYGRSALAIGEALVAVGARRPLHVIIDPMQATEWSNVGWQMLRSAGLDSIARLVLQPSSMALPELIAEGSPPMRRSSMAATGSTRCSSISISSARSFGQAESSSWTTTGGPQSAPRHTTST